MQRVYRRPSTLLLLFLFSLLSLPAAAQQAGLTSSTPSAGEAVALKAATQLVAFQGALGRIWLGFWDSAHVFGIFPVRAGTLVIHPRDLGIGEDPARSGLKVPAALNGRVSLITGRVGTWPFDLKFKIGDRRIAVVSLIPPFAPYRGTVTEMDWLSDSLASLVMFAVHESFHGYQASTWRALSGSPVVFAMTDAVMPYLAAIDSQWVTAALTEERAILRRALMASSCVQVVAPLRQYSALREVRLARLPEPFRAYEDTHERAEGIANWVGYEAVHRVVTHDARGVRRTIAGDLEFGYRDAFGNVYRGRDAYQLWHLYATGSAKTAIISQCGLADWQTRIAEGATLQQLLEVLATQAKE